jgi:beta-mannosidase
MALLIPTHGVLTGLAGTVRRWLPLLCLLAGGMNGTGQTLQLEPVNGWTLQREGDLTVWPARVPGAIHADLIAAGRISDPYFRDNHTRMGWVDSSIWQYRIRMPLPQEFRQQDNLRLVLEGLDTWAEVKIGDQIVLQTDKMFRSWLVDLNRFRNADSLDLCITIHPAILKGAELAKRVPFTYPADSDPFHGKPSVFTRKATFQFGWDFAPSLPGGGIWRPVRLEAWSGPRLEHCWVETLSLSDSGAQVLVHVNWMAHTPDTLQLDWQLGDWQGQWQGRADAGSGSLVLPLFLPRARLWWPAGEGEAFLYPLQVRLRGAWGTDEYRARAGIRTIRLDREPDQWGTAFRFIVNDRPIFCRGANWVPADMFPGRVGEDTYRHLLALAAEAGMNMLRVWGGGIYEHPLFYELADSLGILVWQDFMFAGSMYPADSAFMATVREEAVQQVSRLRKHACLALWCGNNEIEVAWRNWGWQEQYTYGLAEMAGMESDYQALFGELLPELVKTLHPGADYLASSPVSNWKYKHEMDHGNNHFWGVWHGEMALDSLASWIPRFAAEYGMPSYPIWESIEAFSLPEDHDPDHPVMRLRLRSYKGTALLSRYISEEFGTLPGDFRSWVEGGHAVQTRALDIAIAAHFAARPRCAGTLLWQFNEPWPAASWSIVDHNGRIKPAYLVVKRHYRRP